ncbi:MAG: SagB/ThcOx family dehydrogenase [Acidobacteriota bacterium]
MRSDREFEIIKIFEKQIRLNLEKEAITILIDELLKYTDEDLKKFSTIATYTIPDSVCICKEYNDALQINLPEPYITKMALDEVILSRRSIRNYKKTSISLKALSTLLFYSYGVREYSPAYNFDNFPFRTAPSTGALQGVELYIIANNIQGIKEGLYHFNPLKRCIELLYEGVFKGKMKELCPGQEFVAEASIIIALTIVLSRGLWKYHTRYYKYAFVDVGCVAQNIHLVTCALELGSCLIAGFDENDLSRLLQLNKEEEIPALLISVGAK